MVGILSFSWSHDVDNSGTKSQCEREDRKWKDGDIKGKVLLKSGEYVRMIYDRLSKREYNKGGVAEQRSHFWSRDKREEEQWYKYMS